jgi:hypothetical protein
MVQKAAAFQATAFYYLIANSHLTNGASSAQLDEWGG